MAEVSPSLISWYLCEEQLLDPDAAKALPGWILLISWAPMGHPVVPSSFADQISWTLKPK